MQIKVVNLSRHFECDYSGDSVNWAQISHAKYIQNFVFYPYMSLYLKLVNIFFYFSNDYKCSLNNEDYYKTNFRLCCVQIW